MELKGPWVQWQTAHVYAGDRARLEDTLSSLGLFQVGPAGPRLGSSFDTEYHSSSGALEHH